MKFRNASLILAACMVVSAALPAMAEEKASQWEVEIQKTAGDQPEQSKTTWICMSESRWATPPKALTGAQCPDPQFTRNGDTLSWTSQCDTAQGQGQLVFSRGDKRVEGQSTVDANGVRTVTEVEGRVVDRCSL